jgi:signal transduction histidine kinase
MTRSAASPVKDGSDSMQILQEAMLSEEGLRHIARLVTVGQMALCFSHEVRNPLSVLLGYAHMMEKALPKDDPIRIQLESITRNGMRMKEMTESILNFGRKREVTREACPVADLIQEALSLVEPYFDELQAPSVEVKIHVESPCLRITVDRWRMIHVLVNLLSNAADAVALSRERLVSISARPEDKSTVRISVSDTGVGIDPEVARHIFTPFFTTKGEGGNGLGLYIVRRTVEDHGGTITFQTDKTGTVFSICVPIT